MNHIDTKLIRLQKLQDARRVVVKVGSAVLTCGNCMNRDVIDNLAKELSFLHEQGLEVVLVSSGAVAAGRKKLGIEDRRIISLIEKQALAAVGQSNLMYMYDGAFAKYNKNIAQILLTHSDLAHRKRYLNFKNTMSSLFEMNVIPIINENDTVSPEELKFGDNDNLGALVTNLIEADVFICLTDVDSLYTANPETDPEAKPVRLVEEINEAVEMMAGFSKSSLGTGGMQSKISAVKKVAAGGGSSFIGPGRESEVLQKIFSGEEVGTFFLPRRKRLKGRKQWIAFVLKPKGQLYIDNGACEAIQKKGRSLLASGIHKIKGRFRQGDSVECVNSEGEIIAVGLTQYRSEDVEKIRGARSEEIMNLLGISRKAEVIHRDDLVVL